MPAYRHEYKFSLGPGEAVSLRARLRAVLPHDPHSGPGGEYRIRSVYFDSLDDKALREKLNGVDCREKFRVRWYNGDLSYLSLEKKSKRRGLCLKESCPIAAEEAHRLFHGDLSCLRDPGRPLLLELLSKMECQGLRPKTVVDYRREPFVFPAGNVRVTLDRDVRGAPLSPDLLTREPLMVPTGAGPLLEVKYDRFLPDLVRDLIQLDSRGAGAFSKYAAARGFH